MVSEDACEINVLRNRDCKMVINLSVVTGTTCCGLYTRSH